ncbi:hypothetical protein niasHS_017085 [Heterodera schachtii]|uniref:B30.2/SPRY domain-containing protein n=1 Tax=Heterodera schachtii TaxID=97005 RepID=A0ABD2IJQ1_HETSC
MEFSSDSSIDGEDEENTADNDHQPQTNESSSASFDVLGQERNEDEFSLASRSDVFGHDRNVNDDGTTSFSDCNNRTTTIGDRRKMTKLFMLTVVNITVTVVLIGIIAFHSMDIHSENAQINAELESLKKFVGKMEQQYENGRQQMEFYAKMNSLKEMVKAIKTKVIALEEHQKKEENFIGVLKDRFGKELLKAVHPDIRKNISENFSNPKQNCWDVNASHSDLEIFGSDFLKVHYKGDGSGLRSVFAKHPILFTESGIFYFEIKIKSCKKLCSIGLSTKAMELDGRVGQNSDSCAYQSDGQFWANGPSNVGQSNFSHGDFVGCGINLATRRIIFTKNGQLLDISDLFLSPPFGFPLFPFVSLNDSGDLIETNFGPQFKFDPAKVKIIVNFPRQNYWDANSCSKNLKIIGNKSLTVHYNGIVSGSWLWSSVFAKHSILLNNNSSDIFYYEISVKNMKNWAIIFGFADKQQTKSEGIIRNGTYLYESDGKIWINEKEKANDEYSYGIGDTVGMGVHLITRQIIFTRNGQRLDLFGFFDAPSFADNSFHPFVSLRDSGDKIEANFGPNFKFNLATLWGRNID